MKQAIKIIHFSIILLTVSFRDFTQISWIFFQWFRETLLYSSVIQKKHYLQGSFTTSLKSPIYIQLNTMSTEEKPTETPAAEETPKTEAAAKEPKEEESTATFEPIVSYT